MTIIQPYSLIPFGLMLLTISIGPWLFAKTWSKNTNKLIIAILLSIPVVFYLISNGYSDNLFHTMVFDYLPFIILLGALFVITGGIYISGDIEARPLTNTIILGIGALLASLIGTTGAAMLLVRPLIQINSERKLKSHIFLFTIAIVANCGGLLTPIGDPPLFMMYLRGAPFSWFFNLFPEWLFVNGLLLIIFYLIDWYYHEKESPVDIKRDKTEIKPIRIEGKINFLWLAGVLLAVAFINPNSLPFLKDNVYLKFIRELFLLIMLFASLKTTPKRLHQANNFSLEPIREVAYLFLGIFITMIPCILFLESNAKHLNITTPTAFYFLSGGLSSFLDNTPTAVTFHSLALGIYQQSSSLFAGIPIVGQIPENLLRAISLGSVLFGSMTYIGNGPNFMIKSIAEENHIPMPGFLSYLFRFSLIILLPIFILLNYLFIF